MKYTSGTVSSPDEAIIVIRDHLVINGWSVVHTFSDSPGNRSYVLKGQPLTVGSNSRPYIGLKVIDTSDIDVVLMSGFDTSTLTYVNGVTYINRLYAPSGVGAYQYHMRANGVSFFWAAHNGTSFVHNNVGFARRALPPSHEGITSTTAAVSAGTSVVVPVADDLTSYLTPGMHVHIINYTNDSTSPNISNAEFVVVEAVSATSVTLTITKNYDAGALIGYNAYPLMVGTQSTSNTYSISNPQTLINADGTFSTNFSGGPLTSVEVYIEGPALNYPTDLGGYGRLRYTYVHYSKLGSEEHYGIAYHAPTYAGQATASGDIIDDGTSTYIVLNPSSTRSLILKNDD